MLRQITNIDLTAEIFSISNKSNQWCSKCITLHRLYVLILSLKNLLTQTHTKYEKSYYLFHQAHDSQFIPRGLTTCRSLHNNSRSHSRHRSISCEWRSPTDAETKGRQLRMLKTDSFVLVWGRWPVVLQDTQQQQLPPVVGEAAGGCSPSPCNCNPCLVERVKYGHNMQQHQGHVCLTQYDLQFCFQSALNIIYPPRLVRWGRCSCIKVHHITCNHSSMQRHTLRHPKRRQWPHVHHFSPKTN